MAIAFRQSTTGNAANAGSLALAALGLTAAASSALLAVVRWYAPGPLAGDITTPAGYTLVNTTIYGNEALSVFSKVAAGTETGLTVSWTRSDVYGNAVLVEYTGTHIASPVDVYGVAIALAEPSVSPAVTVVNGSLLLVICSILDSGATTGNYTQNAGVTERIDYGLTTGQHRIAIGDIACSPGVSSTYSTSYVAGGGSFFTRSASALALRANSAPTAPLLGSPANATTANLAAGATFTYTFADPDAGDTQSAKAIRRKVGAGAYEYYDVGAGTWGAVEVFNTSTVQNFVFPAAKWVTGTTYLWSVSCKDSLGVAGPYATDQQVKASTPPTVVVTLPTGTYTVATRPVVTWTYSDSESDAQAFYRMRVFTAAQYGIGGFDPATSPGTYDSGNVAGAVLTATVGADLVNGTTYRVYMQVTETGGLTSAWAFTTFTLGLDAPAQPTIAAVMDATLNRVTLTVQGRDNMLTANQASAETDTTGMTAGANTTIARSTAQFLNGAASFSLTSVAAGNTSVSTNPGPAVVVGASYTALASFRSAVTGRSVRVDISWYDAGSALLSTTTGSTVTDTTAGWTQATVTGTAPALAVTARIVPTVVATSAAAEVHFVDQLSIAPGASTTWTRGGLAGIATYVVERSIDAGVSWSTVRAGASSLLPAPSQAATLIDREAPPLATAVYRAYSRADI